MTEREIWGVDLGGTKVGFGTLSRYREEPTAESASGIIEQILAATPDCSRLGLCVAGRVDTERGMTLAAQLPQLEGFPLVAELEKHGRHCLLVNDADAAAFAEYQLGAGRGARTMLFLTVSTGIGGGLVTGGRLYQGANGQAMEVGHAGGGTPGLACPCGRTGCIDTVASGRAIVQTIREQLGQPDLTLQDLSQLALSGHPLVTAVVTEAAQRLASTIAGFCVLLNPDRIVLGGGVIRAYGPLYTATFEEGLKAKLGGWRMPELRVAELHERVGVLGALLVAQQENR